MSSIDAFVQEAMLMNLREFSALQLGIANLLPPNEVAYIDRVMLDGSFDVEATNQLRGIGLEYVDCVRVVRGISRPRDTEQQSSHRQGSTNGSLHSGMNRDSYHVFTDDNGQSLLLLPTAETNVIGFSAAMRQGADAGRSIRLTLTISRNDIEYVSQYRGDGSPVCVVTRGETGPSQQRPVTAYDVSVFNYWVPVLIDRFARASQAVRDSQRFE